MGTALLMYRIRLNRQESLASIYYCPNLTAKPFHHFQAIYDQGAMVSPAYWGSHWPLTRGLDTVWDISDRVSLGPGANSVMSWDVNNPKPIRNTTVDVKAASGKATKMDIGTFVWLIGMTDADDEQLLRWAKSFAQPPVLELTGAKPEAELYASERRAQRLVVEKPVVTIALKPTNHCMNPVFELSGAPKTLARVSLNGKPLDPSRYAWDGITLWLNVTLSQPTELS